MAAVAAAGSVCVAANLIYFSDGARLGANTQQQQRYRITHRQQSRWHAHQWQNKRKELNTTDGVGWEKEIKLEDVCERVVSSGSWFSEANRPLTHPRTNDPEWRRTHNRVHRGQQQQQQQQKKSECFSIFLRLRLLLLLFCLFVCRWCVLREKGKVFANNSIAGRYADTIHFKICFPFIFKPQKRRKKTGAKALLLPDCLKGDLFFFGSGYSLSPMWHVSSILNWTNQTPLLLERRLDIVVALVYQSKFSRVFLLLLLLLPLDRIEKKKRERTAADL